MNKNELITKFKKFYHILSWIENPLDREKNLFFLQFIID
jgi:hypothetical protein